jgi:hypothetical protein
VADAVVGSRLVVSQEHLHHHAVSVLNEHPDLRSRFVDALTGEIVIEMTERRRRAERYLGVTAQSLNMALKSRFRDAGGWQFEATVQDGVIFASANHETRIEGFDIASFGERANLARLWSVCFGRRVLREGADLWRRHIYLRPHLAAIADEVDAMGVPGQDLLLDPVEPTVLGEIQFGNWALAHRDIMKLLAAAAETEIDLFVYVAADGRLADMISQGTVSFDKTRDLLMEYSSVVNVPTWLVGIDFADGSEPTLEERLPGAG